MLQPANYTHAFEALCKQDIAQKRQKDSAKAQLLYEQNGFSKEGGEGDGY